MSNGETTLADQQGKFTQVVKDGRKLPDVEWIPGRILLSEKRLVLASNQGKRTIPLSKVSTVTVRDDASQPFANVSSYLSLQVGNDVTLVAPNDHEEFKGDIEDLTKEALSQLRLDDDQWTSGRIKRSPMRSLRDIDEQILVDAFVVPVEHAEHMEQSRDPDQ